MPVSVEIPEIGEVEFPDSMSSADVAAASGRLYAEKKLPPIPQPPPATPSMEGIDVELPTWQTDPLRGLGKAVSAVGRYGGRVAEGVAQDIGAVLQRGPAGVGEPQTLVALAGGVPSASSEALARNRPEGEPPKPLGERVAVGAVRGLGEMAPALAGAAATGGATLPAWFAGQMGLTAYGETGDPGMATRQAAVGALMGQFSRYGSQLGEAVGLRAAAKLPPALENATIEAGKFAGQQAALNYLMTAGNLPELMQEPDKAIDRLAEQVGINLAFAAPHLPAQARKAFARDWAEQMFRSPEYKRTIDEAVRLAGVPGRTERETPTPPQQLRAAPVEAPKAPETIAPTRPEVEGEVREPVVPTGQPARAAGVGTEPVSAVESVRATENGGRIAIVLPNGKAVVGGQAHADTWNKAVEAGVATDAELASGFAGFVKPDGTAWGVNGKPLPNVAEVHIVSSQPPRATRPELRPTPPIPEQPVKPAEAVPVAQAVVSETVGTEGKRSAQEIKDELVQRIEQSLVDAVETTPAQKAAMEQTPTTVKYTDAPGYRGEAGLKRPRELEAHRWAVVENARRRAEHVKEIEATGLQRITIEIPGDGTFTIWNTKEALSELLAKAKKINTKPTSEAPISRRGISKEDKAEVQRLIQQGSGETGLAGEKGPPGPIESPSAEASPTTSVEPAISFPGIGSLREKQATAMELGKIRKNEPELWKAITQMFGTDQPAKIARLAKQRMEEGKIPPPDVERRAMLAGSHIAGIPDPIALAFAVTFGTKTGRQVVGDAVRFYSEPLSERLATEGGTNSKGFSNMAKEISQRAKELYGSLTGVLDPALEATGKMNRTTTWLNDIAPTKKRWGFRNAQTAVEGTIDNVPAEHRATVQLLKAANLRIGQLAEPVVEGFKATGRYQRPPTDFLIDTIRSGQGQAFDVVKNALAAENKIHPEKVKKILRGIKEELDAPGSEQTVHRIAQEFERHFRKFPTDIRITTPLGEVWMPILHAKPFEYLQNAATRTAQRVSFLERVPKGTLPDIRKAVVSELKSPEAFDDLIRALHGLPVNQPLRFFAPGSLQSMIAQGANRVLSDVFGTLKLTASAIYNIPETVLGNTPAFFGWRNFARGAVGLKERWAKLEELGAINRAIYNFSFDPKAPVRSVLNDFRLGVRKATMQQFFNEMQEMLAASTAQVFAERASGKLLSQREQGLFTETAVAMGFTRPAARAMAEGRGSPEQYGRFTQRAAAFATGGNIQPAELSRFGGNRVLTSLFRFQSYPMMKLNAFRKAYMNFTEAVESKDPRRIKASSEQLAKFLFGTTAQGAAAVFLAALLSGRGGGVEQTAQEAEDNPGKFIFDSLAGGMGGPVSAINYVVGTGKSRDLLNPKNINAGITFPGSIYLELKQLFNTEGPYAGMTLPNAVQKYLQTRVPAGKMVRHAFEEAGLVSDSETARGNLYRLHQDWLRRNPDPKIQADFERQQALVLPESKYAGVLAAMRARDEDGLKKAVAELQSSGEKLSDIKKRFEPRTQDGRQKQIFHESEALERKFRESLTAAQRKLYEAAVKERQAQWDWFRRFY